MRLLKRLVSAPAARREDLLRDLGADYTAEVALVQQLRDHAKEAPYPSAGEQLNQLATAGAALTRHTPPLSICWNPRARTIT